jgi:hypothetical protein
LLLIHGIAASVTKCPELELDGEEADKLAIATKNVLRHYNIKTTQKAIDHLNLLFCAGVLYAPRVIVIKERKAKEREARINGLSFSQNK